MPADVIYEDDAVCWMGFNPAGFGLVPTVWTNVSFVSCTVTPNEPQTERPLKGKAGDNPFDPTKPSDGFEDVAADLVIPFDLNILPLYLQAGIGPATTTPNEDIEGYYVHQWTSGGRSVRDFTVAWVFASGVVRYLRNVTINTFGAQVDGEMVGNQNIAFGLTGKVFERSTVGPGATLNAHPADNQVLRAQAYIDNAAVGNVLSATWNWNRGIVQDRFLSPLPTIAGLRPGAASMGGSMRVRAMADVFDLMICAKTVFGVTLQAGELSGSYVNLSHLRSKFIKPPLSLQEGRGRVVERDFTYGAHQGGGTPGVVIQLQNQKPSYA